MVTILLVGLACTTCGPDDETGAPLLPSNPLGARDDASKPTPLWDLEPASKALLDRVQEELGSRAGVRVGRIPARGTAEGAGVLPGDVLLMVAGTVVASPAAVDVALAGRGGTITLTVLRIGDDGTWTVHQLPMSAPADPLATPAVPTPPAPSASPAVAALPAPPTPRTYPATLRGVIEAYFDMLDFARTEGWSRKSATPEAVRRYAEELLRQELAELDAETRAVIERIPEAWAALRTRWAAADEHERKRQRAFWKRNLLLPNPLLPPTGALVRFESEAGRHAFEHPADWIVAQGRLGDTGVLFLGPAGTQTTWEQVVDPATSPAGILCAISPTDEGLRATSSPEEGARYIAREFVTGRAPEMKEVAAFRLGTGALVAYLGRWAGAAEESFCWVAAMPFGNEKFLAARFSGPVAQAETLLPAFSVILATTEVTPPDNLANLHVELAASIIGNAVVSTGWSD